MRLYALFLAVVLLANFAGSFAQVINYGRCPKVKVQTNFNVTKYMGVWYENRRFFAVFEWNTKCAHAKYSLLPNGTVRVENSGINQRTGKATSIVGNAYQYNPADPAKLKVKFKKFIPAGNYWVVATDYSRYAAVFSCTDLTLFNAQIAWILTRTPNPDKQTVADAYAAFEYNGIDTDKFRVTNQTGCNY